ncbi:MULTISPECIES: hypothetical protein [Acinetobacter]|jgi:hypothetical protein|uniref:hypothetical protein n=1 Tax=Acinetobacter TaxID=469 RepID=UPI0004EF6155|nr:MULTISPECIES: hypothetical protein [Acinetobacter]MCG7221669.1 hypothetical protein [Acinetobacter sp. AG3]BAP36210.1 hypothetical protein AS4_12700 [Acinetobacter guillouiae]
MGIDLKELNKQIDDFKESKDPQRLVIGYKTYSKLMKENKFLDKISKDVNDPMIRYYKEIKIKIVTEKHFFEIE